MERIDNSKQLKYEITRLRDLSKQQEQEIMRNISVIRDNFSPANIFLNSISSITGIPLNNKEYIKSGILIGAGLLIRHFLNKSEHSLEQHAYRLINMLIQKIKYLFGNSEKDPLAAKEDLKTD